MTPCDTYTKLYESHCIAALDMYCVSSDPISLFPVLVLSMQTVALKLKNTDLTNYTNCLGLVQFAADSWGVKLFQRKRVREFLWGYTDDMLYTIVSVKSDDCPSSAAKDVTPFVQIQVR